MKRYVLLFMMVCVAMGTEAQTYSFQFRVSNCKDSVLYVAQHYRDEVHVIDTAKYTGGSKTYVASGRREWPRGIYALVRQDGQTVLTDFLVDDSRRFTIAGDSSMSATSIKVKGSRNNASMYRYIARLQEATEEQSALKEKGDQAAMDRLNNEMTAYEEKVKQQEKNNLFFQLVDVCLNPDVPDTVKNKAYYYRTHYWNHLFDNRSRMTDELLHSPQLFNKMNYFFFNVMYYADADTICREIDRLMARIGDDTAMRRYVMQFVQPRYYRSTRKVGWDAVWCHLVERYYLADKCPWSKESELYVMKKNYQRIKQSIIGAQGQELWMLDTTQIDSPEHWHSSHRQPTKYVILWFWDPDCHHCQEQSSALKILYDSLCAANNKRFEVYAVGYESDVDKWKKYVKEHDFRWINVGGTNVNIDYQEAYNVHGAPTMIILDENRKIIMNKVLPAKNLMAFFDNYEKNKH